MKQITNIYADHGYGQKYYSCTFGMNEKGGMNTLEFMKYVENIRFFFRDYADISGKRIILKFNLRPGRSDKVFLYW